ncbi:hypothetical protein XELAEV_18031376mg [Xenopus laevis]|uniref:GIY-YIG domain-containing protein n=1 Tax=Xenopus laevis TaxID=8355 RepID=A0A974CMI0_XENLA|nr:hypothetical protein XELAEV_18031376mg [Xenopus laevis]
MAYVGQTGRQVKARIKEHRGYIRNFKKETYTDTTVVHIPPRGGDLKLRLSQREMYWISKINTVTPKGLNESWSVKCFL